MSKKVIQKKFYLKNLIYKYYTFKFYNIIKIYYYNLDLYNKGILQGIISKLYNIHGTTIINAITIGNNIVQQ